MLSPTTKRYLKLLAIPAALFVSSTLFGFYLYGLGSKTRVVEAYQLTRNVPTGTEFCDTDLRVIPIESPSTEIINTVMLVPQDGLSGCLWALQDLHANNLLLNDQSSTVFSASDLEGVGENELPENHIVVPIALPSSTASEADERIESTAGDFQLVTNELPPRHIACVSTVSGGDGLLMALEDFEEVSGWLTGGDTASGTKSEAPVLALKSTYEQCPIGGHPPRCGILTTGVNPLAELEESYRATEDGVISVLDDETGEVDRMLRLPECNMASESSPRWYEAWADLQRESNETEEEAGPLDKRRTVEVGDLTVIPEVPVETPNNDPGLLPDDPQGNSPPTGIIDPTTG